MNKVLFFDVETTGRDAKKNDIVQLSGLIEMDGKVVHEFNIKSQPFDFQSIEPEALAVTGLTVEELKTYPAPEKAFEQFLDILELRVHPWAVDRYDKNDKFTPAGYNVGFDLEFLQQWFIKNGESYGTGWFQNWRQVDILQAVRFLEYCGKMSKLENQKLSTLCDHFQISIQAHDALSDIKATRDLILKLKELVGGQ